MHSVRLKYLDAVAKLGSVRSAARHLNVSSSSVTRQIQTAEQQFGFQIFERGLDGAKLTPPGQVVLEHVNRTMRDFDRMRLQIEGMTEVHTQHLKIATTDSAASTFLPNILSEALEEHPALKFGVHVAESPEIWRQVAEGKADIGLNFAPVDHPDLMAVRALELSVGLLCTSNHPLGKNTSVTLGEMLEYPIVDPDLEVPFFNAVRKVVNESASRYVPWVTTNSLALIKSLVETGKFISLRTRLFALGFDNSKIKTAWIPITDVEFPKDLLVVAIRKDAVGDEMVTWFAEFASAYLARRCGE
ncbi:LysR family transcriptional regulator [Hoeflea poritis]|uniref:LysR family transcriptional regulator n=1 Tax=Hoeflea poritis TaxID=2993659 RepID=A0ABT4VT42_9HYPH|nr:LysR family transcriptional regulator [Hoeflea poritis]MDA4847163.1 LysR family transcriptional regulator [Hoeflea poritis]